MAIEQTWIDRALGAVAPQWQLRRLRARLASELVMRHYEGAAIGRRTQGWNRSGSDANTAQGGGTLARLREVARDLVRNNPYAESAVATIADHTVGTGIIAKPKPVNARALALWRQWAETTACDADGRHDFYGLQKMVVSAVVESGEVLVRRRIRRVSDGFPIPLQLQLLEPDYLDTNKTMPLANGGQIIQGVEFDPLGRRAAYWLFPNHPGSSMTSKGTIFPASRRIDASEIRHVFQGKRPGQVRAASWFAPTILRFKDFDEFEDATLMKQKIAACLAVITSDVDGTGAPLGAADDTADPVTDTLEPGAILNVPPGRNVEVVQPPTVGDYASYCGVTLRAIATGLGVSYEDLTGDYTGLPFSAARMSRLRHWARVEDWRWRMLIPQFCDPVWGWAMEAAQIMGVAASAPEAIWTAPPPPMLDPSVEGLAYQRLIRTGITSLSEAIRERGYDPDELLAEIAADNKKLDELGIVLDSDARQTTQHGMVQTSAPPPDNGRGFSAVMTEWLGRQSDERVVDVFDSLFGGAQRAPVTNVHVAPPAVSVAGATVNVAPPDVRVEAPITVQAAPAPDVRVDAPITVNPPRVDVNVETPVARPMKRTVTARDAQGRPSEVVETPVDAKDQE